MRVAGVILTAIGVIVGLALATRRSSTPTGHVSLHDACHARTGVYIDESVRVPWTEVGEHEGIEVDYCVLRGHADAEVGFLQDAEHLVFTTRQTSAYGRWVPLRFTVKPRQGEPSSWTPFACGLCPTVS